MTLVEDVITTGGAVRDATRALREAGAVVETVVCAIDRSPEGENPLADVDLEVRPVLTKAQLDAARGESRAEFASWRGGALAGDVDVGPAVVVPVVGGGARRAPVPPPLVGDRDDREGQDHDDRRVDVLAQSSGTAWPRK